MIVELSIRDFAIIDNLKINFTKGFNVLTGETGAGKSIIIESIGMILGQRANRDLIRTGKEKAVLEGIFFLENPQRINSVLESYGIDSDPDNYLIITREIYSNGRSISRVNGRTVTLNMLNNITVNLVDIHGQYEHQSLLNTENHIKLIDTFGGSKLKFLLEQVANKYSEISSERRKLQRLTLDSIDRDREMDLLKYQIEEIENSKLGNIDEEEIYKEYSKMSNIKEIGMALAEIANMMKDNNYGNVSIIDNINKCISNINRIKDYDDELKDYSKTMEYINYELQELYRSIIRYLENLEIDDERLMELEKRIDTINKLKRKYGNTIDEILEYKNEIETRYNTLLNIEEEIAKINNNIRNAEEELSILCAQLTDLRKEISERIEKLITKELEDLNMDNVVFKVDFKRLEDFTEIGWDRIEFLISTNKGEELKPLTKIISGGEMSRIMLAFKRTLADYDHIPTLIFDEIDTGISGRAGQVVGEKIKMISENHQVICISHLPQIAALADTHFLIDKKTIDNKTTTIVKKLNEEERIDELSRLLGGVNLTDTTKLHAKEMLEMSKKLKSNFN